MQAFAYTHYVPSKQLIFMRTWLHSHGDRFKWPQKFNFKVDLRKGKSVTVPVTYIGAKHLKNPTAEITLPDAPKGVTMTVKKEKGDRYLLTFKADPKAPACNVNIPVKVKFSISVWNARRKQLVPSSTMFHLPMIRLTVR